MDKVLRTNFAASLKNFRHIRNSYNRFQLSCFKNDVGI